MERSAQEATVGISRSKRLAVKLYVGLLARTERVARDDPRIRWVMEQAQVCVREGMGAREAVHLAAVVAFRRYGRERPVG
jgi:hypothetical protein